MFNAIYRRRESVNYECKHTDNSWIILIVGRMALVGSEEIMQVCDTEKN